MVAEALQAEGHSVIEAMNPEEALRVLRSRLHEDATCPLPASSRCSAEIALFVSSRNAPRSRRDSFGRQSAQPN
jgi:hypothetical protein